MRQEVLSKVKGLDLDNMTFVQLKQELEQTKPDSLKDIIDNIMMLVKFGEIMKIPELKF